MHAVELEKPAKGEYIEATTRNWTFDTLPLVQVRLRRTGERCQHDEDTFQKTGYCPSCFGTKIVGGYDAVPEPVLAREVNVSISPTLISGIDDEWGDMDFLCDFQYHITPGDMFVFGCTNADGSVFSLDDSYPAYWKVVDVQTESEEGDGLHLPTCWRIQCRQVQPYEPARLFVLEGRGVG